jgi:hypothetical protein
MRRFVFLSLLAFSLSVAAFGQQTDTARTNSSRAIRLICVATKISQKPLYIVIPQGKHRQYTLVDSLCVASLSPKEITKLRVSNDVGETAIWGSRGAGGVIYVTVPRLVYERLEREGHFSRDVSVY